jgi:hypothetical protein
MKLRDLDLDAWKGLIKSKYVVQMHSARDHNVEKAAIDLADAGLRLLGEGRHVARVVKVREMFENPVSWLVKLNTGAVFLTYSNESHLGNGNNVLDVAPQVGDRLLVRASQDWEADTTPSIVIERNLGPAPEPTSVSTLLEQRMAQVIE